MNNIRQLGLATGMYESTYDGKLPRLYREYSGSLETRNYGWAIDLFPYVEQGAIFDVIQETGSLVGSNGNATPGLSCPGTSVRLFACPDHIPEGYRPGAISYAANIGYVSDQFWGRAGETGNLVAGIDWDRSGAVDEADYAISRATAVFLPPNSAGVELEDMTIDYIARGDGTTNTFLFLEYCDPESNWASPSYGKNGVGISIATGRVGGPPTGKLSGDFDSSIGPLRLGASWTAKDTNTKDDSRVNSDHDAGSEQRWRPKSSHPGVVLVCLADTGARALNDSIDEGVFARMFTPNGSREFGQFVDGGP